MNLRMIILLILFSLCLLGAQSSPTETIAIPLNLIAGTNPPYAFSVPAKAAGAWSITLPCDSAWSVQIYVQQSDDNGKTWNCNGSLDTNCLLLSRQVGSCAGISDFGVIWGAQSKARLQITVISNLAKTVTATATFVVQ